jgi:RNA polymerase sigma factor (sigma-70 family)
MADADLPESPSEPELKAVLDAALSRLPAEQREAIELAVGARMNYQQIAERTGVQGITVQRRINRGLLALRVALRDYPYFDSFSYPESDRSCCTMT